MDKTYLYAFDLSMDQTGLTIFDMVTYEPVVITHVTTNDKESHGLRLHQIAIMCKHFMDQYPVSEVAIERGFSRFNTSTQVIYRVHGVVNLMFKNYKQFYYPPKTVKAAICNGNATKKQVRGKIELTYPNVTFENEDESDSFAVGLCHLISKGLIQWDNGVKKVPRKKRTKKTI